MVSTVNLRTYFSLNCQKLPRNIRTSFAKLEKRNVLTRGFSLYKNIYIYFIKQGSYYPSPKVIRVRFYYFVLYDTFQPKLNSTVIYLESARQILFFFRLTYERTKHLMSVLTKKMKNRFIFMLNYNNKFITVIKSCTVFDLAKRISGALLQNSH